MIEQGCRRSINFRSALQVLNTFPMAQHAELNGLRVSGISTLGVFNSSYGMSYSFEGCQGTEVNIFL